MKTRILIRGTIALTLVLAALTITLMLLNQPPAAQALRQTAPLRADIVVTTTIQAAIDSAQPGDTVIVPPGIYSESLTLYKPVNLVGSGPYGFEIHALAGQRVMTVTGASITASTLISGLSFLDGDLATGAACPDYCGGGILIRDGAFPLFRNVIIAFNRARSGGGLYVESGGATLQGVEISYNTVEDQGGGVGISSGNVTLGGGTIIFNTAHSGGGVYVGSAGALFTQFGGQVGNNFAMTTSVGAGGSGGGLYIDQGQAVLRDGQIDSNQASFGGGVYLFSPSAQFVQAGGVVVGNSATEYSGGGLYVNDGQVTLNNGVIGGNTAQMDGGGVFVQSGSFSHTLGVIVSNQAYGGGGGLYLISGTSALNGGAILDNHAVKDGGGLFVIDGEARLLDGQIVSNTAGQSGGGVYLYGPGSFKQMGGSIERNEAIVSGGGLCIDMGTAVLSGGQVFSNTANEGGGVQVETGTLTLNGAIISSNTAWADGGGVYVGSSDARLFMVTGGVENNTAYGSGGGVKVRDGTFAMNGGRIGNNTANYDGGGVYLYNPGAVFTQTGGVVGGNLAYINGGGVHVFSGNAILRGGDIINNTASSNGGGVYVHTTSAAFTQMMGGIVLNQAMGGGGGGVFVDVGRATLTGGRIISNTAGDGGGGGVHVASGEFSANGPVRIVGNSTLSNGGGIYAAANLMITGTKIFGNQAAGEGGGVYHTGSGNGRLVNSVLARNQAGQRSSEVALNSTGQVDVLHVTIADSALNSGSAVVVSIGTVNIVNTIIASHTAGIDGMGGVINEDYNLFYGNSTPQTGTINHGGHSFSGDPAFINPDADDYHITRWSAALNTGTPVGVFTDMDNQPRPVGSGFDIGADEAQLIWGPVGPSLGWMLNYTNTLGTNTQLQVPPGSPTGTIVFSVIETSTVPAPPANYAFGGDTFELQVLMNISSTVPISLTRGVTLTIRYSDQDISGIDERFLALYRAVNMGWEKVGVRPGEWQTLDTLNNVLTAHLLSFSRFQEMGVTNVSYIYLPIVLR